MEKPVNCYINSNISDLIKPIILKILENHPQSLHFPFMVIDKYSNIFQISEDNSNYNNNHSKNLSKSSEENLIFSDSKKINLINNFNNKHSDLYKLLKKYFSEFTALNAFVEALDCMNNPELRLKYWVENLKEIIQNYIHELSSEKLSRNTSTSKSLPQVNLSGNSNNTNTNPHTNPSFKANNNNQNIYVNSNLNELKSKTYSKIRNIIEIIYEEIFEKNKKYVKNKIGTYNHKFAEDNEKLIKGILNSNKLMELLNLPAQELSREFSGLLEVIHKIVSKSSKNQREAGIEKLSTFSEWLAQYECFEFSNVKNFMEISNFFSSNFCNSEKNKDVKVTSFDQHVLVLASVRKPKRLTVFGNNEKSYQFLVKGDEDLRLDQRIMEIFKVYNEIISKDSNCSDKNLKMNTFSVMPITVRLGIIEWVDNTVPLRAVVKHSMNNIYGFKDWDFL